MNAEDKCDWPYPQDHWFIKELLDEESEYFVRHFSGYSQLTIHRSDCALTKEEESVGVEWFDPFSSYGEARQTAYDRADLKQDTVQDCQLCGPRETYAHMAKEDSACMLYSVKLDVLDRCIISSTACMKVSKAQ